MSDVGLAEASGVGFDDFDNLERVVLS